ncbi:MAG TPA: TetR/AcrR family transcriptional regulator [Candidatus Binatia bacterium]|nr:TetR/AcrR family transcriptional regulator [Candidatus Binatia bacterium]
MQGQAKSAARRPPPPALVAARRDRLLEELEHVFLRDGFLHFRTEELARRLRCSKRALYQIAPSREKLFEVVVDRWLTKLRRSGHEAARAAPDPLAAVTDYLGAAIVATRDAGAQFVRDLSRSPAAYRRLMSHQRERIAGLERLIEEGTARGHFRGVHAKLIAEVMLNAVAQLVDPEVLARVGLTMSQAFAELYDIVEHGLLPRNGLRSRSARNVRRRVSRAS